MELRQLAVQRHRGRRGTCWTHTVYSCRRRPALLQHDQRCVRHNLWPHDLGLGQRRSLACCLALQRCCFAHKRRPAGRRRQWEPDSPLTQPITVRGRGTVACQCTGNRRNDRFGRGRQRALHRFSRQLDAGHAIRHQQLRLAHAVVGGRKRA